MMFKKVLLDDLDSMLLSSLNIIKTIFNRTKHLLYKFLEKTEHRFARAD